jgi:DNA-binding NtrC family response regulator
MKKITEAFVKTVDASVEDCSSISQLSQLFRRFQPYMYNTDVYNVFYNKVNYFKDRSVDCLISEMCESLIEDMEVERMITGFSGSSNKSELEINITFYADEGDIMQSCVEELLRVILSRTSGNITETSRVLGISETELKQLTSDKYENFIKSLKRNARKGKVK